jgi:hydrophobic/amphiphilic exporter-1 (mainly G- bacteria), HAE1 family
MRPYIEWAVKNTPGVNMILLAVMAVGVGCFWMMRRETFPEFKLEVGLVTVIYPGASPEEVERGICQKVEEAVRAVDGIKQVVSIAREGGGFTVIEMKSTVKDPQKVINDIRSEVDRIPSFPLSSEKPLVQQITFREPAIRVAVIGPESDQQDAEWKLREVAELIRDEILALPEVSQANVLGAKPFQIDVEIPEDTLQTYGLSLSSVAQILRRENVEIPGGQLKAEGQEILLRGNNKREVGEEILQLPLITRPGGLVLTVGDLGKVRDDFEDQSVINEVNGKPSLVISVDKTSEEDLLAIADAVHRYVKEAKLPAGYSLEVWGDTSVDVRDRIRLLRDNGLQSLVLVFIVLTLFLERKLAFWVALGIPISILGAGIVLMIFGQTLNMLSMFAFLMALGIVVDDAIVIGENIYSHRMMGKSPYQAAVDGASEVIVSVISSVATTVMTFMPLFYVTGVMGKFIAVMPLAVIAMLCISLVESTFSLPNHLAHSGGESKSLFGKLIGYVLMPFAPMGRIVDRISAAFSSGLEWFGLYIYKPMLVFCLRFPLVSPALAVCALIVTVGLVRSGVVPFVIFPKSDGNNLIARIVYPDGTPLPLTDESTQRIEAAARRVGEKLGEGVLNIRKVANTSSESAAEKSLGPILLTFRQVGQLTGDGALGSAENSSGSHVGQVYIELVDAASRSITSNDILNMWREEAGDFPGAERITFDSVNIGPGGKAIEFKLLAPAENQAELNDAIERCKGKLATYAGVFDIRDDATPGKLEFQYKVKDRAIAMGITASDLAETVRNAYYGAEVQRLQRGRHEVKLMVRYPQDQRRSLADFKEIKVRGPDGVEVPITELAEIKVQRGYSEINRLNQKRSITVSADVDEAKTNAAQVIADLKASTLPELIKQYPTLSVDWEGQQQQSQESMASLGVGLVIAILAIYILLVIEFNSYFQPFIIIMIIPFGFAGAIWGHGLLGIPITLFSVFGMVALTGVVVNDSIVLVDFINSKARSGMPLRQALAEAGLRRMRPVFLTSITTIAGLAPMIMEKSFQAQFLVPMAASLAFGLGLTTLLVLFQVPVLYLFYCIVLEFFGFDPTRAIAHSDEDEAGETPPTTVTAAHA